MPHPSKASGVHRRRATALLMAFGLVLMWTLSVSAGAAPPRRVVVSGAVLYDNGRPAPGQHVELSRVTGVGDALAALFTFGFSGGLFNLLCFQKGSDALVQCGNNTIATRTGNDGRFSFTLSADIIDAPDRSFTVLAKVPSSSPRAPGAEASVTTRLTVGTNRLPALTLWQPTLTGPVDRLRWTPPVAPGVNNIEYGARFIAPSGLLIEESGEPPLHVDARLLEDSRGTFALTAHAQVATRRLAWTAPAVRYSGTAGSPPSRLALCQVAVELVRGPPHASPRCWLTDGRFGTAFTGARPRHCSVDEAFSDPIFGPPEVTCEYASVTSVEIDLGREMLLDAVVPRGECPSCRTQSSVDHTHWWEPDVGTGPGQLISWHNMPARWIRVVADPERSSLNRPIITVPGARPGGRPLPLDAPGDVSGLTELSVWPAPLPSAASSAPMTAAPSSAPTGHLAQPSHGRTPASTVFAAVVLLLAAGGATGYSAATRGRRAPSHP